MVLFHASFVALKARCPLTIHVKPEEYTLAGELILFRAYDFDLPIHTSLYITFWNVQY